MNNLCEYGCGKKANFIFKNGKKCCSKNHSSCSFLKIKKSKMFKGRVGNKHSEDTKKKISESNKGRNHHSYGKVGKSYKKQLTIKQIKEKYPLFSKIEEMRYDPNNLEDIQVHCKNHNCKNSEEQGGWFTVNRHSLFTRIYIIEKSYYSGESNFYCCEECKQNCPLYNFHYYDLTLDSLYTSEEYQTWRTSVMEQANYSCEYCEKPATDAHHTRPKKLEPGFVLDPDFGIACCEKCHYKYGHKTGTECSTGNLAVTICNH